MPQASTQSPGIFICYRRDDSAGHAIHLLHYLRDHLRGVKIFMDIIIEPGTQFAQKIAREVGSCEIFIPLIGKDWLTMEGDAGRRLDDPEDFVCLEIATALARDDITVIPVLVDGASIPNRKELPKELVKLPDHQQFELSNQRWEYDADRLVLHIKQKLAEQREARRKEAANRRDATVSPGGLVRRAITASWGNIEHEWRTVLIHALLLSMFLVLPGGVTVLHDLLRDRRVKLPSLVPIPGGSFLMGSANGHDNERPVRKVTFAEGFYMGRYEVTQAEWLGVMDENPSSHVGDNLPVENVSWDAAQEFVRRLNQKSATFLYSLPTEAQWEYACRGGAEGNDYAGELDSLAWYKSGPAGLANTHEGGGKAANLYGLHDMHGNVWEWCADQYQKYSEAPSDGTLWQEAVGGGLRVLRGGAWESDADSCRCAFRNWSASGDHNAASGLRVAALLQPRPIF